MSRCRQLEENFFVSSQVSRASLQEAARLGITRLINNRPDFEEAGQPTHEEVSAWASELGLEYYFVPVVPGDLTKEALDQFSRAIDNRGEDSGATRVMASCRTGTRSCALWALARASRRVMPVDDIVRAAKDAGYDIAPMKASLEQLAALPD